MLSTSVEPQFTPVPLVLLVDRDFETRNLYRHSLMMSGWRVDEADDGREALAKAIDRHPNLVVTEIRLPFIDGYSLCELLRSDPVTHDVPIVVLTADAYPARLERARKAGADSVLVKPCLPEELQRELLRLSDQSLSLRARSDATRAKAALQLSRSAELLTHGRHTLVRAHARFETTSPPLVPPALRCPSCDHTLQYERSHIGGVSDRHSEQWDYYICPASCGTFQYRHRTRKLRRVS